MIRTPALRSVAAGLLTFTVLSTIDQPFAVRADDKPDAAAAKVKQLEEKIAALEANQQKLLNRLEDLEYPELRHRDADEIRVLKRKVDAAQAEHRRIDAFRRARVIGGEALLWVGAAYRLAAARAELAWAEGHVRDAVQYSAEATFHAEERLRQYEVAFQSAVQKIGMHSISASQLGEILAARAHAQQGILRALAVAEHAKVDVRDVNIEFTSLDTKEARSLSDVLKLVRSESTLDQLPLTKKE